MTTGEQQEVLSYLKRASIIPICKDKKPLISWKEFQTRKPTKEEVEEWFRKFPDMNIGIVTGKISNLAVVDIEKGGSCAGLPDTLIAQTGGGGWHYYYQYTEGIDNRARIRELTDIRGSGGYVVSPPSLHQSGQKYKWLNKKLPAFFPKHLFGIKEQQDWTEVAKGVSQGQTNETAAKYIGKLMNVFSIDTWENTVWETARIWNEKNIPCLPERELRLIYESIGKRARTNKQEVEQVTADFIPFNKVLTNGINTLLSTKEEDVVSFGYDWLDNQLTGLFPSELLVIGSESGSGKTTFATNIIYKASKKYRCALFALEDRLDDYAIKKLYFEIGKIRKSKGLKNYPWNDYRKNTITNKVLFEEELKEAEENIKSNNIFFADVRKQLDIDDLEKMIDDQVANGTSLFLIDHLHYFDLLKGNSTKADYIEQLMVRLKTLQNRNGARIILIVHYKKLDGQKPKLDSFKDSISIVQNANYVINIWRDRNDALSANRYKTTFIIPKSRNPNGEGTIEVEFDPETNDYKNVQDWKFGTPPEYQEPDLINNMDL